MAKITWGDDSIRIRMFQTAMRVSTHFYETLTESMVSQGQAGEDPIEQLLSRWPLLKGDQSLSQFEQTFKKELLPLKGHPVFDRIQTELDRSFSYGDQLWRLNQSAFDSVRRCISQWGGTRAKRRLKRIKLLPLHCESGAYEQTQFSFEPREKRILVRPGEPKSLLAECMILEFSLFHEYLSHAFPSWDKDVEQISEGWLFALEFDWFESEYTFHDNDMILRVWKQRLEKERDAFWAGRWLLRRCNSQRCVRKFLLEWVAGWEQVELDMNLDLLSQLQGIYLKTGHKLGGHSSPKDLKTLDMLDKSVCGPCAKGRWDISSVRNQLESALRAYLPPKP